MLVDLTLFAICAAIGLRLQRRGDSVALRDRLWQANYFVLIPLAAAYAFLSIELDETLLGIVACAVGAWWLTVAAAGAYAAAVAPTRSMRGALWLAGAFPNTGFIGFPLANLAYGADGLRLAVIYDQVSLVVPAVVVATVIAARHAAPSSGSPQPARSLGRQLLASPPLWMVAALLLVRATVLPEPVDLELLGRILGHVVGPIGFLLLGLSLPLGAFTHDRREVLGTIGAAAVRILVAPLLVWAVARMAGVDVPNALYLIAAMPTAFLALVLSRMHGLEVGILRLSVLTSSVIVITATVVGVWTGVLPGA